MSLLGRRSSLARPDRRWRRPRMRAVWVEIHLYVGLIAGLFLAVICLSGAILAFRPEIERMTTLRPDAGHPKVAAGRAAGRQRLPVDALVARIEAAEALGHVEWVGFPENFETREPDGPLQLWAEDAAGQHLILAVDPYTGEVLRRVVQEASLFALLLDLHVQLGAAMMGQEPLAATGSTLGYELAGVLSLIFVVSLASGVYLWWPRDRRFRRALRIRRDLGTVRLLDDLHRVLGTLAFLVLIVVAVTAIHLYYPETFMAAIAPVAPTAAEPERAAGPPAGGCDDGPMTVARAAAVARAHAEAAGFDGRVSWIELPETAAGARYRAVLATDWGFAWGMIWIDARCPRVLEANIPGTGLAGDALERWIWPLHTGYAFGFASRLVVGLSGLVAVGLYVTGLVVWWQKRKARKRRKARLRERRPDHDRRTA